MKSLSSLLIIAFCVLSINVGHGQYSDEYLQEKLSKSTSSVAESSNSTLSEDQKEAKLKLVGPDRTQKKYFDQSYHKYLKSSKKKHRFGLSLFREIDPYFADKGTNNLSLVRQGHKPYYHRPSRQYSLPQTVLFSLVRAYASNL